MWKVHVFVWPGHDSLGESFIWLKLAGRRVEKVEVGFVFSNSVVHYAVREIELHVVCRGAQKTANGKE